MVRKTLKYPNLHRFSLIQNVRLIQHAFLMQCMHTFEFQSNSLGFIEVSLFWCLSFQRQANFSSQEFPDTLNSNNEVQKVPKYCKEPSNIMI